MKKIIIVLTIFILSQKSCLAEIRILFTAALIDLNFDERKKEYIKTLEVLDSYGYTNCYIVEAIKSDGPTFLEKHSQNVIYSNVNNSSLRNKGVNEAQSIKKALNQFKFDDNDMIIKITGRYFFTSDTFLIKVKNSPEFDAFFKTGAGEQIFTGCFALRYKYFKEFIYQLDLEVMESNMINIEWKLAQYIESLKTKNIKIMKLDQLDITANIFGNGNSALYYW